jgi:hypothetical protein
MYLEQLFPSIDPFCCKTRTSEARKSKYNRMATLSGEEKLLTEILGNFVANHLKGKHSSHLSYLKIAYRFVEKYIIYCYQKTVRIPI